MSFCGSHTLWVKENDCSLTPMYKNLIKVFHIAINCECLAYNTPSVICQAYPTCWKPPADRGVAMPVADDWFQSLACVYVAAVNTVDGLPAGALI